MTPNVRIQADVAGLVARVKAKLNRAATLLRNREVVNGVQSYVTGAVGRFARDMSDLSERPDKKTARGVTWAGWAVRNVKKYGQVVKEGTRYRYRGFRRTKRNAITLEYKSYKGRILRARKAIAKGTKKLEQVWNKRASGVKHGPTSKMLFDTGAMVKATLNCRREVKTSGGVTTLTLWAGRQVKYFEDQHRRRPIWFLYPPEDGPAISEILAFHQRKILQRAINEATYSAITEAGQ